MTKDRQLMVSSTVTVIYFGITLNLKYSVRNVQFMSVNAGVVDCCHIWKTNKETEKQYYNGSRSYPLQALYKQHSTSKF
jgi:hypothetical protein